MITTINNKHNKLNVPNLRFPEFQGEWEKYKVSDLLDFYSTNSLSWDKLEYGTDAIQNLHYGLIHVGLSTMIDLSKDKLPNITNGNTPKNYELCPFLAHPTNPVECCADANPKTMLPNDT